MAPSFLLHTQVGARIRMGVDEGGTKKGQRYMGAEEMHSSSADHAVETTSKHLFLVQDPWSHETVEDVVGNWRRYDAVRSLRNRGKYVGRDVAREREAYCDRFWSCFWSFRSGGVKKSADPRGTAENMCERRCSYVERDVSHTAPVRDA